MTAKPQSAISPAQFLPIPLWVRIAVVLGALLMAMGAIIALLRPAMLVSPGAEINPAAHVYAGYLVSRNLALAALLLTLLALSAKRALSHLMVLVAIIQLLDTVIDCAEARWTIAPGVLIFGIIYLVAANQLNPHPLWKAAAWK